MIISTIQEFVPRSIRSSLGEVARNRHPAYTLVVSIERISIFTFGSSSYMHLGSSLSGLAGSTLNQYYFKPMSIVNVSQHYF